MAPFENLISPPRVLIRDLLVALIAVLVWLSAVPAIGEHVGYQPDYDLQDEMEEYRKAGHECLPPSYSIQLHPFWVRMGAKAFDTCVNDNMTQGQLLKYMALGAGSLTPAGVYVAPYTISELKSDGLKCLMKAYVETSDGPSRSEKDTWNGRIDAGFAAKDWHGFVTAIPELADPDAKKVTKAFFDISLAAYERRAEAISFTEAIKAASQQSWRDVNIYFYGELPVVLEEYDQFVRECRYETARLSLNRAKKLADRECRALGHEYRLIEQELVSSIYRTWEVMEQDLIGDSRAMVILRNKQRSLKRDLAAAKAELQDYVKNFDELEKKDMALDRLTWAFEKEQKDYALRLERTRQALDSPAACYAFQEFRNTLSDKASDCRAAFFSGSLAGLNSRPEALERELYLIASRKTSVWWGEVNKIQTLFNTCREAEGFGRIETLKRKMQTDPVVLVADGVCQPVEQPVLMDMLNKFSPLPRCRKTTVPEIVGKKLSTAVGMLNDAELVVKGRPERVNPKEGQAPGVVVKSDPRPGSSAQVWTGVRLTITDKPQEEEDQVEMPKVLGLIDSAAKDAVSDAGLTPVVKKGRAADKIEYKPDYIYHANHDDGDMLAPLTEVVMTKYGPRPKVKVPKLAGSDMAKAYGILTAAGFVPGNPAAGKPAPADKEPGEIYGSLPETGSKQDMFTTVQPLVYGPHAQQGDENAAAEEDTEGDEEFEKRPIPPVIGKPPQVAISMIEKGKFFVVGTVSPGNPAKDGEKPGTVQLAVPAAGSPQPEGTVVNLRIVMRVQGDGGEEEEGATPDEGEGEDDSWIGRWRVSGKHTSDSGKVTDIQGMMEIAPRQGMLTLKWSTIKDGKLKKIMELPVAVGPDNVLRVHPDTLKKMESEGSASGSGGVIGGEVNKIALMFKEILKTLEISRRANQCAVSVTDPKKGPMKIAFNCIREDDAGQ